MVFSFYRDKGFTVKLMDISNCSGNTCCLLHYWEISCICSSYHLERKASGFCVMAWENNTFPRVPGEMRSQALATCLASGYLMYKFGQALNWLCFNFWFLFSLTSALLRGPKRFVLFIAFLGKSVESWSQIHINGLGFSGHSLQQRLHPAAFLMAWHLYPRGYPRLHGLSSHRCF